IAMSSFTVIVQNQYPTSRLGEVSAGLQFFRSIGGTIGLAVFGTILNNQFLSNMKRSLPSALKPLTHGPQALPIDNPQVLLAPDVQAKLHAGLDKLFGSAAGERLYTAFLTVTRDSLASAIAWLFVIATIVGAVGLVVVLFLKEAPLRRTHDLADVAESLPRLDDAEAASEAGGAPGAAR
ncbi:MAG TPA: hypothetical protein VK576_11605, partial [Thermoleophilia bacterium]|nr:hypothetical protein [Thermoleophilia bacterium]